MVVAVVLQAGLGVASVAENTTTEQQSMAVTAAASTTALGKHYLNLFMIYFPLRLLVW